jgi:hypothetical protein
MVLLLIAQPAQAAEPWEAGLLGHLGSYGLTCQRDGLYVTCTPPDPDAVEGPTGAGYVLPGWDPDRPDAWTVTLNAVSTGWQPPHGIARDFLVGAAPDVCPRDAAAIEAFIATGAKGSLDGTTCTATVDFVEGGLGIDPVDVRWTSLQLEPIPGPASSLLPLPTPALTLPPVVAPSPSAMPIASSIPVPATAAPTSPGEAGGAGSGPTPGRGDFALSIPRPGEVTLDPMVIAQSALLALLIVFLMPFPAQLFNSTLEEHEAEVRRWLRLGSGGAMAALGRFWASWVGVSIFVAIGALLYCLLDPAFGSEGRSVAKFIGMLLGLVLVTAIAAAPTLLRGRREGVSARLKAIPLSLVIGVLCVVTSRLVDFQPGYLYGVLIGLTFARELSIAEKGRETALAAGTLLGVALVSWLALGMLPRAADADLALTIAQTTLSALLVAGLEAVTIGLLPLRFLPGESLYQWNRVLWGSLLGIGAFAFFHILINPTSGYLADTNRTPLLTTIGLLVGFGAVSVAFWGWFRFRSSGTAPSGSGGG